jgi:hypothetical protein
VAFLYLDTSINILSNLKSGSQIMTPTSLYKDIRELPLNRQLALLALPLSFLIISVLMRHNAGPFWLWSNLDPDYWYLIDSLNMVNGDWPKHIAHPGTTVQWIGTLIIKALHPFSTAEDINVMVLSNPEQYLSIIGHFFIALNTTALILVGMTGYLVFRDLSAAILIQMGPFLSKLIFKWTLHVSPEPLLVTTVIAIAIITVLALREGQLEKHGTRYAVAFAVVAGFGMVTKVTSAGIYLMPIVLRLQDLPKKPDTGLKSPHVFCRAVGRLWPDLRPVQKKPSRRAALPGYRSGHGWALPSLSWSGYAGRQAPSRALHAPSPDRQWTRAGAYLSNIERTSQR